MLHKNMRDLFVQDLVFSKSSDVKPIEPGQVRLSSLVTFDKAPDDTVFVASEDGDSIMAIVKPKTVIVPMAQYDCDEPVQERIAALIQSASVWGHENQCSEVPANQAIEAATKVHGERPHAILANQNVAMRIQEAYADKIWEENAPKLYESALLLGDDLAYFVGEPEKLGHAVISIPTGKQGLLLHGKVTTLRIGASESSPTATGA